MTRDEAIGLAHYALATAQIEPIADMFLREVAESRKEALEEAAAICDGVRDDELGTDDKYALGADECAEAIRRLAKIGGTT